VEVFRTAVALMVRSMVLSAQSASQQRLLWLQQSAAVGGEVGELARLREENRQLKSGNRLLKVRFGTHDEHTPYPRRNPGQCSKPRGQPESGVPGAVEHGASVVRASALVNRRISRCHGPAPPITAPG